MVGILAQILPASIVDPAYFNSDPDLTFHSILSLNATPTLKIIMPAVQSRTFLRTDMRHWETRLVFPAYANSLLLKGNLYGKCVLTQATKWSYSLETLIKNKKREKARQETVKRALSGSGSECFWASRISINKQSKVEKPWFWLLFFTVNLRRLKGTKMYLQKVISKKALGKNLFFVGILSANDKKTGSGSVRLCYGSAPKCHGSTTLAEVLLISVPTMLKG